MGMFSELTTETNVRLFVDEIKRLLKERGQNPEVASALKELGRFALTQFEWDSPTWVAEYETLFAPNPSES